MPTELRVFLNERAHTLPAGSTVRDAVVALVPELLPDCESGTAGVTDARGLPLPLDSALASGAILRVLRRSARGRAAGPGDAGV